VPCGNPLIAERLAARLQTRNVLGDLINQGHDLSKRRQARIRWRMDLLRSSGTVCDQPRVDLVVLGSLQVEHGVGPHLRRLEYDDDETILPKLAHNRLLVTPARLDTNPTDLVLAQPDRELAVPLSGIWHLQLLRTTLKRYIKLVFAGINAGADYASFAHLLLTLPCDANLKFGQPYGS
jgi:hypothetical protein